MANLKKIKLDTDYESLKLTQGEAKEFFFELNLANKDRMSNQDIHKFQQLWSVDLKLKDEELVEVQKLLMILGKRAAA